VSGALAALALALFGSAPDEAAVAAEWRARAWALAPQEHGAAIERALADERWSERVLALDAAARLPEAARRLLAREAARDALRDPHPNVRAAALRVWAAAHDAPPELERGEARRLAADPFEGVRAALVELAARRPADLAREPRVASLALLAAGEGQAAEAARRLLLQEGRGAGDAAWAAIRGLAPPTWSPGEELALAVPWLLRAPVDPALVQHLRALFPEACDPARALVEAVALHGELDGPGPVAEREVLARAWSPPPPEDAGLDPFYAQRWRSILREVAEEGDAALGGALLSRALAWRGAPDDAGGAAGAEDPRAFLVEGAAAALDPREALERALALPDELAGAFWSDVRAPLPRFDPERGARWLAPERGEELRFAVAVALAETYEHSGDEGAESLLLGLLDDADSELRRSSFRWLANGPRRERVLERVHAAWRRHDPEERRLELRLLPREVPLPAFRDDLLALCADPRQRRAELIELLGGLRADPEVSERLRAWLEEASSALAGARDAQTYGVEESRAKALAEALGAGAVEPLAAALERSLAAPPPASEGQALLPKTCIALLGARAQGRALLARYLDERVERRARTECALQLLGAPETDDATRARAVASLLATHARCDDELGARVLVALGGDPGPEALAYLVRVAADERAGLGQRLAALAGLGHPGAEETLGRLLEASPESEVAPAAVAALAAAGTPAARARLAAAWPASGSPTLRGELLVAWARLDGLESVGLEAAFERPLARAASGLSERFRRDDRGDVRFRWDAELRAARELARRGALEAALDAHGAWWRLDSELLAALAEEAAAAGASTLERALLCAARVALAGEGLAAVDAGDRRFALEARLLDLALAAEDWSEALDWSVELAGSLRLDRARSACVAEHLGRFDRRAGRDPWARVDVLPDQLRALAALARRTPEDRARAAELLAGTRARLGASAEARALQRWIEERLDA